MPLKRSGVGGSRHDATIESHCFIKVVCQEIENFMRKVYENIGYAPITPLIHLTRIPVGNCLRQT